jgi:hypothetical protein
MSHTGYSKSAYRSVYTLEKDKRKRAAYSDMALSEANTLLPAVIIK